MSFWARLFGSPSVVDKTVDAVINTGDALVFTDEERSQAELMKLEWVLKYHEASKGSNLARRLIGVLFTFVFLILVIATAVFFAAGAAFELAAITAAGTAILELMGEVMVIPMSAIIGFYFTSGMVRDWKQSK